MPNRWKQTQEERFWSKVNKTDTCWLWTGYCMPVRMHGQIYFNGKLEYAHRVSWFIHYGPIPDELEVLHKCDIGNCVKPTHLYLGTQLENIKDAFSGPKLAGKLTLIQVEQIKTKYALGNTSHRKLAEEYGVTHMTIGDILRGKSYTRVYILD